MAPDLIPHPTAGSIHPMKRRQFLKSAAAIPLGAVAAPTLAAATAVSSVRGPFALDGTRVRLASSAITRTARLTVVADTHLFRDDQRGAPFIHFSQRMARAYNQTRHFATGQPTHPEAAFDAALRHAQESQSDLLALVGDLFSFPSEAAIEWVQSRLTHTGVPYQYTAGNHDWHYEGMTGSLEELRSTWSRERLLPMHQGQNPLMSVREVAGVRILMIDNSNYEILPAQLDFFRSEAASAKPLILMVHIPLHAPGRPLGFGCGHPDWNAKNDRNHELERRERWRESGHTPTTMTFHREVFTTPNLLAIFAGHVHRPALDVVNGIPQFVTEANAVGAWLDVELILSEP